MDGIEVINVCNEDVLHGLEGADGERAWEVGVHYSGVEVGKGGKTKHVAGSADFFGRLETVNIATSLDDGRLHGAHGPNALSVAPHVPFVGCSGIEQMGFDKMRREAGGGLLQVPCFVLGLA
jgi:hypothetical protein